MSFLVKGYSSTQTWNTSIYLFIYLYLCNDTNGQGHFSLELGLGFPWKVKNPTTLVRTKDLKVGHFKNSGPVLASCLGLGSHSQNNLVFLSLPYTHKILMSGCKIPPTLKQYLILISILFSREGYHVRAGLQKRSETSPSVKLRKAPIFCGKLSFILFWPSPSFFLNAYIAATYIFNALTCTTITITLEPCALDAEFQHFIPRFNKNFLTQRGG
jgi:hypothetical protein